MIPRVSISVEELYLSHSVPIYSNCIPVGKGVKWLLRVILRKLCQCTQVNDFKPKKRLPAKITYLSELLQFEVSIAMIFQKL